MSIYLELRKEPNKRGEHAIRLVILTDRKTASRKNTGYAVEPKYWDEKKLRIKSSHPNSVSWNTALESKLRIARDQMAVLDAAGRKPKAHKIAQAISMGGRFQSLANHYAEQFRHAGKIGTADRYVSIANVIEETYPGLMAIDMDQDWAEGFKRTLLAKQQAHNTIVGKLRAVNSILNKAAADHLIAGNPLEGFKKGSFRKSNKLSLDQDELELLWNCTDLQGWERMARLTFLFSYYAAGARFKDVLLMPETAIYKYNKQDRFRWQPNKTINTTAEWVDILLNARLRQIIDEAKNDSKTIFGLVDPRLDPEALETAISRVEAQINKSLKGVLRKAGIAKDMSFHSARHSFTRIANERTDRDVYGIQGALGHGDIKTTEFYLGKDLQAVDDLTAKVYGN